MNEVMFEQLGMNSVWKQRDFHLTFKIGTDIRIVEAMRNKVNRALDEFPGSGEISDVPTIHIDSLNADAESYYLLADDIRWNSFLNRVESFMPSIEMEVKKELGMAICSA